MDQRLTFPGGEREITNDELNLMPDSNRGGIQGLAAAFGAQYIISGVNAVINTGTNCIVNAGFVFLNGEVLKVNAQTVVRDSNISGNSYQFVKQAITDDAGFDRDYRDGTTHNVAIINTAVPTQVPSINSLSVIGDTLTELLTTAIQFTPDWTAASGSVGFIDNKPTVVNRLMYGTVTLGDIGAQPANNASKPVTGDLTSAFHSSPQSATSDTLNLSFPSVQTTAYMPVFSIESLSPNVAVDNSTYSIVFKNATSSSIQIHLSSDSSAIQNIRIRVYLIAL